jgi:GTP-binding protein
MHHPELIRNVAIIAHVDHGKTTLVDELFKQSGTFRDNEHVAERMMDSMDLERERGITIRSKNGTLHYAGHTINIIDTPGHADFGGEVERVLQMADGALLLVDAQEGPMPQTYFVLKKALARHLPIVVVINKIDKPAARPHWAVDQIFDLFVSLNASHKILDFHVVFASARDGHASLDPDDPGSDMKAVFDAILKFIPAPVGNTQAPLQLQVASIDHSSFLGRLGIGKITAGRLETNMPVVLAKAGGGELQTARITKIYRFDRNRKVETDAAGVGDIVAVAGLENVLVGDTYTDPENPTPLPALPVDPPTVSMNFLPNNSPFAGTEGEFSTSSHLAERLKHEALSDVALQVEELADCSGFKVSGRGELHISIKVEQMRREGYEFQVSSPHVILRNENGQLMEPYEELTIDVPEAYMGTVIEKLGGRKGQMQEMHQDAGMTRLRYIIPTRGLLGFKSEFMSDTKGMGVLNYVFHGYGPHVGEMRNRHNGVLVCMDTCTTVAYALFNLQDRGHLFLGPGERVYRGQIIGAHCRTNDLLVNPAKGKKLTNIRAAGSDENVILTPPIRLSLEDCIAYINDDELVEITPKSVRLRKDPRAQKASRAH